MTKEKKTNKQKRSQALVACLLFGNSSVYFSDLALQSHYRTKGEPKEIALSLANMKRKTNLQKKKKKIPQTRGRHVHPVFSFRSCHRFTFLCFFLLLLFSSPTFRIFVVFSKVGFFDGTPEAGEVVPGW